jgi:hypothetical protein
MQKYGPNLEGKKNPPKTVTLPTLPLFHTPPLYYTEKSYTKIIAP